MLTTLILETTYEICGKYISKVRVMTTLVSKTTLKTILPVTTLTTLL